MARQGDKLLVSNGRAVRESPGGVDVLLDAMVRGDGPGVIQCMPQDPAQAGKDQAIRRKALAHHAGANEVRVSPEYSGKIYRADTYSAECEKGNVFLVDDGTWDIEEYISELCAFPVGKYADYVDASSRVCNELLQVATIKTGHARLG